MEGKKTPLYAAHLESGAKVVEFGGWLMPVQYSGIIEEHHAVRTKAGLFDVSHMGEFVVKGPDSAAYINSVITNNVNNLSIGQILYTPMCYPEGGVVDDLLVYRLSEQEYLLVVNAGNIEKDYSWLGKQRASFAVEMEDISENTGEIALQGPASELILNSIADVDLTGLAYYWLKQGVMVAGVRCLVSRTGYTGEDGFELYCTAADTVKLWQALLDAGKAYGLAPAGLGARDTLRFEACLPLYGHELSATITPLEAGLKPFVKFDKEYFNGQDSLSSQLNDGLKRKIVGLEMTGRGIARAGHVCMVDGKTIGEVTSGSFAPTFSKNLALALLDIEYTTPGTVIQVDIRGKQVEAIVIPKPFYRRSKK